MQNKKYMALKLNMDLQLFAHTAQERYSSLVLAKLRKTAIFTSLFNTKYEGKPTAGAVKIPVRDTEVEVGDYDKANGGDLNTGSTTYRDHACDRQRQVCE